MFITYESCDEIIVCTPETEPETLKLYFGEENNRDFEDYDREIRNDAVAITSRLIIE
jgi:hypothetical protein